MRNRYKDMIPSCHLIFASDKNEKEKKIYAKTKTVYTKTLADLWGGRIIVIIFFLSVSPTVIKLFLQLT